MTDEVGREALIAYMKACKTQGSNFSLSAYRKARLRLKLEGYRTFTKTSPVLGYDPKAKTYYYARGGTNLEPVLSP